MLAMASLCLVSVSGFVSPPVMAHFSGAMSTLGSGFSFSRSVAVDGSGNIVQPHVLDAKLSVIARQIDNAMLAQRPVIHVVESTNSAGNTRGIDRNTLSEGSAGKVGAHRKDGQPSNSAATGCHGAGQNCCLSSVVDLAFQCRP
jgi:hypothetical protein